jgi:hypothetical protein
MNITRRWMQEGEKTSTEKEESSKLLTTTTTQEMSRPTFAQQLYALSALTLISTCIGFTTKMSQVSGKYKYSPASAVVMTELFKLVSSVAIAAKILFSEAQQEKTSFKIQLRIFLDRNFSRAVILHELGLAVAYCIVNLVTYLIFMHATASVFFLLKAASPVVTAIMLKVLVGRSITGTQWFSIVTQCVGLVVTQYNPCTGSSVVSVAGYVLIVINISVSCAAGVWNEHVIKNYGTSVNAQNIVLYCWGIAINMAVFLAAPPSALGVERDYEFFEGYNWIVIAMIAANGSVGLVITAVYKYADVVVKTFGLAGSTVLLYVLEAVGVLPKGTSGVPTAVVIMGAMVVFYAAYLYIAPQPVEKIVEDGDAPPPSPAPAADHRALECQKIMLCYGDRRITFLACGSLLAVFLSMMVNTCNDLR